MGDKYLKASIAIALILGVRCVSDKDSRRDPTSWMVVLLAASLWAIVVPISILERFTKD